MVLQQQPQLLWTHLIILGRKNKHSMDVCKATYAAHTEILKMSKNCEEFVHILEDSKVSYFVTVI
jgi:hypothetical protein